MSSITVAILALDEERMIERAIASALWADEVLVIDGGSRDRTIEISERAGARVVERPFDDFARQRNFALEAATGEWVLFVDADERIPAPLADEIRAVVAAPAADAYAVPRRSMALGRWLDWHLGNAQDAPVRLVRLGSARWVGAVHERIEGAASVGTLREQLVHLTHRTVSDVVRKIDRYTEFQADEMHAAGAPAPGARDVLRSFRRALRSMWRGGLKRHGDAGAVESFLLAFNETLALAKLWERHNSARIEEAYRRADAELPTAPPRTTSPPRTTAPPR